jgi:ribosomal protein L22
MADEAKPARRSRAKKKADEPEVEATEAVAEAAQADEPVAEEKAKPARRSRAKKADPEAAAQADVETTEAVAEAAQADEPVAEEKAKPARRSRAKKDAAAEPPAAPAAKPRVVARPLDGRAPVVRAQAKYVRTSARKARLVCDHIRGKSVDEARAILLHTPRHVARDWSKLLESAVANAEHNHELVGDDLQVAFVTADEGPTLKRFRPRAMGRATPIRKRTSHLTIGLTPKEQ